MRVICAIRYIMMMKYNRIRWHIHQPASLNRYNLSMLFKRKYFLFQQRAGNS